MIRRGLGRFHRRLLLPVLGLAFAGPFLVTLGLTGTGCAGPVVPPPPSHRLVLHVNSEDPAAMRHAISSSLNATRHYGDRHEPLAIEIVAAGTGIHMFRTDTSPVKEQLRFLRAGKPDITFTACGNTKMIMERNEGRPMALIEATQVVPFGIARMIELQEAGWSYPRP